MVELNISLGFRCNANWLTYNGSKKLLSLQHTIAYPHGFVLNVQILPVGCTDHLKQGWVTLQLEGLQHDQMVWDDGSWSAAVSGRPPVTHVCLT